MNDPIPVLDQGYVRYEDHMGQDLKVANAAKASFERRSETLGDREEGIVDFLARSKPPHTSPFRHSAITFEVRAPLVVARQWWKYVVGSDHTMDAWNEGSRRYVTESPAYHLPDIFEWRSAPENRKQGSGPALDSEIGKWHTGLLRQRQAQSVKDYETAIEDGVAPEQARLFLLAYGLYVRWWWTGSLQSVLAFLSERLKDDAQYEIRKYAEAVHEITVHLFPFATERWLKHRP